jgi:hypothetical protein
MAGHDFLVMAREIEYMQGDARYSRSIPLEAGCGVLATGFVVDTCVRAEGVPVLLGVDMHTAASGDVVRQGLAQCPATGILPYSERLCVPGTRRATASWLAMAKERNAVIGTHRRSFFSHGMWGDKIPVTGHSRRGDGDIGSIQRALRWIGDERAVDVEDG